MFSASHSVVARNSGRARPLIVGIIRPWSPPSCPTPRSWRRSGRPSQPCRPGSTSTPARSARSLPRPPRRWPSWRPASATSGAPTSTTALDVVERMAEARAGVAALVGADVDAVALTHATTDGMNAATLLPDWRAGGRRSSTSATSTPAASARCTRSATGLGSTSSFVDAGADGDDARTIAAFDAAITAGHPARLDLARPVDDRGGHAGRADRRDRPRARRPRRRRRRPGRRRDPGPLR